MMTRRTKTSTRTLAAGLVVGGLVFSLAAAALVKPPAEPPLKLISFAVNLGVSNLPRHRSLGIGDGRRAGIVQIGIDRWSPHQELDSLLDTLRTRGADKMLNDLQKAPRVGYAITTRRVSWSIHYAPLENTVLSCQRLVTAVSRLVAFS